MQQDDLSIGCGEFVRLVKYKCWREAFCNGREILQTCPHSMKESWVKALVHLIHNMGRDDELPSTFDSLTILARIDVLDHIQIKFR